MTAKDSPIELRFDIAWSGFSLHIDTTLPGRGVTALFGESGSGKTTCLRLIAGLERGGGYLAVNGEVWQDETRGIFLPTHRRPLGYVFQEASLFPHLSVRRNLEYGLRRVAATARKVVMAQSVELLGIGHLLERMPAHLSGGERQRVAIARALLTSPALLLMDEPLASLDAPRKREILPYLERLHDQLEIPLLYVSHAIEEVSQLADHLVLLSQGRVVASGGIGETLARLDLPLATAADSGVVIEAVLAERDARYRLDRLAFAGGSVWLGESGAKPGQRVRLRVHARDVSLALSAREDSSILNSLPATVVAIADAEAPAQVMVRLDVGGTPLLARITRRSLDHLGIVPGLAVWAQIKSVALLA